MKTKKTKRRSIKHELNQVLDACFPSFGSIYDDSFRKAFFSNKKSFIAWLFKLESDKKLMTETQVVEAPLGGLGPPTFRLTA